MKYIPKVGDKVKDKRSGSECLVLGIGDETLFVKGSRREYADEVKHFKPIPTKADVEREQLIEIMRKSDVTINWVEGTAGAIQKAGFTIPKKVKRSEINLKLRSELDWFDDDLLYGIEDMLCELLGDLVEDEL